MTSNTKGEGRLCLAANVCYTDVKLTQFDYLWIIKDFSFRMHDCYQMLESSIFTCGSGKESSTWSAFLWPRGPATGFVSIGLNLINTHRDSCKAVITFSVLNAIGDNVETFKTSVPHDFLKNFTFERRDFVRGVQLFTNECGLLHGNTLSILCKIDLLECNENVSGKSNISQLVATESLLSDDFGRLLEKGDFSDVTLQVGDCEFRVHKAVLVARSHVFAAMFEHKMTETATNRVVITDLEPDVLREMLRYIYTNNVSNEVHLAESLLVAADKYGLVQLMRMCEFIVGRDISIETAADILLLADSHNAKHLKAHAIEYINLNATNVMNTDGWRNILKSNSHLIADAYEALVMDMKSAQINESNLSKQLL